MAGGRDKEDTRGFSWVDMKDSKGNIVKDSKGNAVKTRKFGAKAEAPATSPKPKAKPVAKAAPKAASKPTSSAPTKSIRPKAKPAAASKPTTGLTDSQRTSLTLVGSTDLDSPNIGMADKKKGRLITTNTKPKSAVSGASRGTTGKSATRLARLKKEAAMQRDRSAVKLGLTLRERNQK